MARDRTTTFMDMLRWLPLFAACCCGSTSGITLTGTNRGDDARIGVLQWNLHGECFVKCTQPTDRHCDHHYPACRGNSTNLLRELLDGSMGRLDFAGTEQLNDEEFLASGLPKDGEWGRVTHNCGGTSGFGVYPFDSATIFYRRSVWTALGEGPQGGCMERVHSAEEGNYRAFVVQAFQRRSDRTRVVVVAAHNPHNIGYSSEIASLAAAVQTAQERAQTKRLIFIADTNWEGPNILLLGRSSQTVMEDIYPDAGQVASTELHTTCCAFVYMHAYDRVIVAGFPGVSGQLRTELPFADSVPPWVALHMHNPIIGWIDPASTES